MGSPTMSKAMEKPEKPCFTCKAAPRHRGTSYCQVHLAERTKNRDERRRGAKRAAKATLVATVLAGCGWSGVGYTQRAEQITCGTRECDVKDVSGDMSSNGVPYTFISRHPIIFVDAEAPTREK